MKLFTYIVALLVFTLACNAQGPYTLDQIQGAWWSDRSSPTADFAIMDAQVWLDIDAQYHPCEITGDNILVFDLGPDNGKVEHRIVNFDNAGLVLENLISREVVV